MTNNSTYEQFKIYDKFELVNTCTIDYHLMSLWLSWKYFSKGMTKAIEENRENPHISGLIKIISLIDNFEWDRARTIWALHVNKIVIDEYCRFNAFGTEFEYFVKHMREFQKYKIVCECGKELYNLGDLQFKKIEEKCIGNWEEERFCNVCQTSNAKLSFENQPFGLFIEPLHSRRSVFQLDDYPKILKVFDCSFKLLCCTFLASSDHFKALFWINDCFYLVDDLDRNKKLDPKNTEFIIIFLFYS